MKISRIIAKARIATGMSQSSLGKTCRLPQSHICRLESGRQTDIKVSTLERLAEGLKCRLSVKFVPLGSELPANGPKQAIAPKAVQDAGKAAKTQKQGTQSKGEGNGKAGTQDKGEAGSKRAGSRSGGEQPGTKKRKKSLLCDSKILA